MNDNLRGKVALVAGATRGAGRGIAVALGEAGATVWCTGRSTRADTTRGGEGRTPFDLSRRPETIEDTAELVTSHGGTGIAARVDHMDESQVKDLVARISAEHGRLDVLVNDVWGGDSLVEWGKPLWELDPATGFTMVDRVLRTHAITARHAVPLMVARQSGLVVEITDGHFDGYRGNAFYDLAKVIPMRLAYALSADLVTRGVRGITALALTPGFLRSEAVLEHFGVTETTWRDAIARDPHFAESETPRFVGRAVAALAADPDVGSKAGRAFASWELAVEYGFDDVDGSRPHWGSHLDASIDRLMERGGPSTEEERGLVLARYFQLMLDPSRREWTAAIARRLGLERP